MKKYVISDIHGCKKTFIALLDKIGLSTSDELYLLGDYIDRGPDSKGVLDTIFELQQNNYKVNCLRGNHEQMLLDQRSEGEISAWTRHGGLQTLQSFGIADGMYIPHAYIRFLTDLPYYLLVDDYLLVHAGVNFKVLNPLEDIVSMIWLRDWYKDVDKHWLGKRIVIHGHTPMSRLSIQYQLEQLETLPVLDIDNGCCFNREGMGALCAFDMGERKLVFQRNVD